MNKYKLYAGAKFEVGQGPTLKLYEVLHVTSTHVTYTDHVSDVPRSNTIKNFMNFLKLANAKSV